MTHHLTIRQLSLVIIISLAALLTVPGNSQKIRSAGTAPPIGELESQYGSLELNDEFLVLLETAQMEQALQEEDSIAFAEGFSGEGDEGGQAPRTNTIVQFMNYFISIMRTRIAHSDSSEQLTGTFDFTIRDINLERHGNKIDLNAIVEFPYLTINDSTKTPMAQAIEAEFQPKNERWKIKQAHGLFEFFNACIMRLSPGETIPEKFLALAQHYRPSEVRQNGKGGNDESN